METVPVPTEEQTQAADGKVEEKKTEDVAAVATEKPTQPEEAAAKTESEPVTNGTSEHPKDESSAPHQPQTPESAAATAVVAAVVEEKKPEQDQPAPPAVVANIESAEQPKVESASVAAPEVVAKTNDLDQKQQNGAVDESPAAAPTAKIEVNAEENVSKDNDEIKDRIETQPEQKIDNEQDTIKTNDIEDGENESAQNLPPPPLPFTPPPSQVMVFALSENKSNEQEQTIIATNQQPSEIPAAVEPLKTEIPESVEDLPLPSPPPPPPQLEETPVLPAAPEAPAPENQQNVEVPPPSEEKPAEEQSKPPQEQQPEAVIVESKPEEPSVVAEPEKIGGVRFEESEKPAASEIPETVPETVAKIETELNPDKIAETIALIDEVTQEAAVISQKMLDESSATSNTDTTTITSPSSHPEGNLSSPPQLPSTVEQPEPLQSPTQIESSPEETQPTNVETQAQVAPEAIGDHVEIVSPPSNLEQESQPQQIVAAVGEVKAELIENNQSESLDKSKDDQITVETDINKSVAVEQQQPQQDDVSSAPISKENGVAENGDDHPAETSATESLNGHAEEHNKTIEEMKAEQAEKIKTDNVAEPVAVAE